MRRTFDSKVARFSGDRGIDGSPNRGAVYATGGLMTLCSSFGVTPSFGLIEPVRTLAGDLSVTILKDIAQWPCCFN
jgi:hypothetical protein